MSLSPDFVSEPVPISLIAGRYLLFDVNVVTYLRRVHHICGTLIGSIPQAPQQNIFHGLPVELMPEEAKLLVENEIAYIIDDAAWHKERFNTLEGEDRQKYLGSLRAEGLMARKAAQIEARKRSEQGLAKVAASKARKKADKASSTDEPSSLSKIGSTEVSVEPASLPDDSESLFSEDHQGFQTHSLKSSSPIPITPSTSYDTSSLPQNSTQQPDPPVPSSYPLFAHLHSRGYYLMPGLRFGCHYNVYPGDPLRFHSHFLATSYEYHQEIPALELVGGGRLGTAVKKGFLIGGADPDSDRVRTFSLEWGGM